MLFTQELDRHVFITFILQVRKLHFGGVKQLLKILQDPRVYVCMCLCVCARACVRVCTLAGMCICVCVCCALTCGSGVRRTMSSSSAVHLGSFVLRVGFLLTWDFPSLGWLASEPKGSSCCYLPTSEITRMCHHTCIFFSIVDFGNQSHKFLSRSRTHRF